MAVLELCEKLRAQAVAGQLVIPFFQQYFQMFKESFGVVYVHVATGLLLVNQRMAVSL